MLREAKGPQIILSRACTEFLIKAFEQEVPEIYEGIVSIEAAAREPGARSKIAVSSRDSDVDPVGACVGMRGSRVQAVVQELRGEKIDIVPWNTDSVRFVCSALAPAQVVRVMVDDSIRSMDVIVPDDQLSLAIGKKGQNVRLAVQLTRWKIDIKSESFMREVQADLAEALSMVEGAGEYEAKLLLDHGVASLDELAQTETELLISIPGISEEGANQVRERAQQLALEKVERERLQQEQAEQERLQQAEQERLQQEQAQREQAQDVVEAGAAAEEGTEAEPVSEDAGEAKPPAAEEVVTEETPPGS